MPEERDGFLKKAQEQTLEKLYKGKGWIEKVDGFLIRMGDDKGLELVKDKMSDEAIEMTYQVIDTLFETILDPLVAEG